MTPLPPRHVKTRRYKCHSQSVKECQCLKSQDSLMKHLRTAPPPPPLTSPGTSWRVEVRAWVSVGRFMED
ncbi:hypothetical protein O3P69_003499 [Scylla paramamosain]|uniref:Uncharacterized protein n=1 Tax=Scylla paramamosain TaxID=85552 RepID=A0AAW0UH61_SCYPA